MAKLYSSTFRSVWTQEYFENFITQTTSMVLGLKDAKETLKAFCLASIVLDEAEIVTFLVRKKDQKKGMGSFLLGNLLNLLQERGVSSVFLEVHEHNKPALHLYRKACFEEIAQRPHYYAETEMKHGNALLMKRNFFLKKYLIYSLLCFR